MPTGSPGIEHARVTFSDRRSSRSSLRTALPLLAIGGGLVATAAFLTLVVMAILSVFWLLVAGVAVAGVLAVANKAVMSGCNCGGGCPTCGR